jgi:hypothetical protein
MLYFLVALFPCTTVIAIYYYQYYYYCTTTTTVAATVSTSTTTTTTTTSATIAASDINVDVVVDDDDDDDDDRYMTPNLSMRMSNLVACVLRPQLRDMDNRGAAWNTLYSSLEAKFNSIEGLRVPARDAEEEYVASSIQFHVHGVSFSFTNIHNTGTV